MHLPKPMVNTMEINGIKCMKMTACHQHPRQSAAVCNGAMCFPDSGRLENDDWHCPSQHWSSRPQGDQLKGGSLTAGAHAVDKYC